ncbi:MAG: hypothetical protein ACE5JP_06320 [Candidatus Bipolaricaulia bacterium]
MAGSKRPRVEGAKGALTSGDIAWGSVFVGYGIAVLGTLLFGGLGLFVMDKGMWWVANWGLGFLLLGGLVAGFSAKTTEPLNGAFIAVFYFATATLIIFIEEFLNILPDPLPGLPRGDSTFFFVWPLGQLVAATVGASLGGWFAVKRRR